MKKKLTSAQQTMQAVRRFSRRTFLKTAGAAGSLAAMGPWIVADAQSSSGSLNILNWDDELPDPVIPNFEKTTGIKVNLTPFSQNEEQINKLQATKGARLRPLPADARPRAAVQGHRRAGRRSTRSKLTLDGLLPSLLGAGEDGLDRGTASCYHVPHCWGTEAISLAQRPDQDRSRHAVLRHAVERRVQGQGAGPSALAAARHRPVDGRHRQAAVEPHARRLQGRRHDEEALRRDAQGGDRAASRGSSSSGIRPTTPSRASCSNGVVIGQTWDGPAISLKKAGQPISFMAPKEGAIGWIDGWSH